MSRRAFKVRPLYHHTGYSQLLQIFTDRLIKPGDDGFVWLTHWDVINPEAGPCIGVPPERMVARIVVDVDDAVWGLYATDWKVARSIPVATWAKMEVDM